MKIDKINREKKGKQTKKKSVKPNKQTRNCLIYGGN